MTEQKRAQVKELVNVLTLSPFYFSLPIRERLDLIHELMERYQ